MTMLTDQNDSATLSIIAGLGSNKKSRRRTRQFSPPVQGYYRQSIKRENERTSSPWEKSLGGYFHILAGANRVGDAQSAYQKGDLPGERIGSSPDRMLLPEASGTAHGEAMPDDALTDAKIAAAEARTDTKFAALAGRIDLLVNEVQGARGEIQSARTAYVVTAIASVLAIGGLIVGLLAYGAEQFGLGAEVTKAIDERIDAKLDHLIEVLRVPNDRPRPPQ